MGSLTPGNCGITTRHIGNFQAIAKEKRCFIFVRLVNRDSTTLIDEGYATKKLDIHAKSSDWGPMAGFICTDSSLSKVADDATKRAKNDNDVKHARHAPGVGTVALEISTTRAQELQNKGTFPAVAPGTPFEATSKGKGTTRKFRLDQTRDGKLAVLYEKGGHFVPVEVLGYKDASGVVKAVTADYDIFAICPHHSAPGFSLKSVAQVSGTATEGVLSSFQKMIKREINLRCGPPDVVNHGTELNNPFPENEAQIAMFPPGGDHRLVLRAQLHLMFGDMAIRGFHVYVNQLWGAAFKTHIGAKMSRLQNPALRGALRLEHLPETDFDGLRLDGYGGNVGTAATAQRFGVEVANNRAQSVRPAWRR